MINIAKCDFKMFPQKLFYENSVRLKNLICEIFVSQLC